jgi:uncharacterized phage-associated protein/DNA-binding transcriptional regulator YiaG
MDNSTAHTEIRVFTFRKESFNIVFHYRIDNERHFEYTTDELNEINLSQIYNQYRAKYQLPFTEEIISIRKKYDLPATKMAEVLGFGTNIYRNYENGEIPNESNARLIQLSNNPQEFLKLLKIKKEIFSEKEYQKLQNRIHQLALQEEESKVSKEELLLGLPIPNEYNGYKQPNLKKFCNMVLFFAQQLQPYKTKLNKLLFYADFLHFKQKGFSISGAVYIAIDHGPVPKSFDALFEEAINEGYVEKHTQFYKDFEGERFFPNSEALFDSTLFSDVEVMTLNTIVERFKVVTSSEIRDISHEETAWIDNNKSRKKISYKYSYELKHI